MPLPKKKNLKNKVPFKKKKKEEDSDYEQESEEEDEEDEEEEEEEEDDEMENEPESEVLQDGQGITLEPDLMSLIPNDLSNRQKTEAEMIIKMYEESQSGDNYPRTAKKLRNLAELNSHIAKKPGNNAWAMQKILELSLKNKRSRASPAQSSIDMSESLSIIPPPEPVVKKPKFCVENPTEEFLNGTKSVNGFTILNTEKVKKDLSRKPPHEAQITNGYAIGDNAHVCLITKKWGDDDTASNKHFVQINRKYQNARKEHGIFSYSFPYECTDLLVEGLANLKKEHAKILAL